MYQPQFLNNVCWKERYTTGLLIKIYITLSKFRMGNNRLTIKKGSGQLNKIGKKIRDSALYDWDELH